MNKELFLIKLSGIIVGKILNIRAETELPSDKSGLGKGISNVSISQQPNGKSGPVVMPSFEDPV